MIKPLNLDVVSGTVMEVPSPPRLRANARAKAFYLKTGLKDVGSHVFIVGTDRQTDRILVRQVTAPLATDAA